MPGGSKVRRQKAHSHRSGSLHQRNKQFKGDSKHQASQGGRQARDVAKTAVVLSQSRTERLNARRQKQKETLTRSFARLRSTGRGAPLLVAVVGLSPKAAVARVRGVLCSDIDLPECSVFPHVFSLEGGRQIAVLEPVRSILPVLDALKVADVTLFVVRASDEIDEIGDSILSAARTQGMPTPFGVVEGLEHVPGKRRHAAVKYCSRVFATEFNAEHRAYALDSSEEVNRLLRTLKVVQPRTVLHRSRPHLCALSASWRTAFEEASSISTEGEAGILSVSGWLRGEYSLSANDLVYVVGCGTYQLGRVEADSGPRAAARRATAGGAMDADDEAALVDLPDSVLQESLQSENVPDVDAWPTDEEIAAAEAERLRTVTASLSHTTMRRVPAGTGEYQAAWIPSDDEDEGCIAAGSESAEHGAGDEIDMDASGDEADGSGGAVSGEEDAELSDGEKPRDEVDGERRGPGSISMEEKDRVEESRKAEAEWRSHEEFPDELDTPIDRFAHIRFARYRGLQSIQTSPWDVNELLPRAYGKIFQFEDISKTEREVRRDATKKPVTSGSFVVIDILGFPKAMFEALSSKGSPVVVIGLLKHEQCLSVVHFMIRTVKGVDAAIVRSKSRLLVQYGARRVFCNPLFSEIFPGTTRSKFDRFLPVNQHTLASVIAPLQFGAAPVLVFEAPGSGEPLRLLATGSVSDGSAPNRILLKRIVLSGFPVKIYKRTAIVRYLFFFPEDIRYFKPIELWTKFGRRGHIVEPVGTHGRMRCRFDGHLKSQDTVCMSMYKRVFPKEGTTAVTVLQESEWIENSDIADAEMK